MVKKLTKQEEENIMELFRREGSRTNYRNIRMSFGSEKSFTFRKLVHCSECNKENIISFTLDDKLLKKALKSTKTKSSLKEKDLDKIFESLVSVSPPKS